MTSFDERARDWDTDEKIARATEVATAIRAAVAITPGSRAIEIGAGTGLLGLELAGELGELVLTDTSTGMLEVAQEKIDRRGLLHVRAVTFDLFKDPSPGAPFDLLLSLLVLHHLQDTEATIRAAYELLVPGGHLALADLDLEDGTFHDADAEGIHHHGFDRHRLVELAVAAGFDDVETRTATEIERDGRRYPLFLLTARRPALREEMPPQPRVIA